MPGRWSKIDSLVPSLLDLLRALWRLPQWVRGLDFQPVRYLLRQTYDEWWNDNAMTLGAALAFYTTFSIAPVLIIIIGLVGFLLGRETVQAAVISRAQEYLGSGGSQYIQEMLKSGFSPGTGVVATIIGLVVFILGATGALVMLAQALNLIWEVTPDPEAGLWSMIKDRLWAFAMILIMGTILLLSLLLNTGLSAISSLGVISFLPVELFQAVNSLISFVIVTLLFAMVYRVLPDVDIAWNDVWIGALITALLFTLGKFLLGLYLGRSSVTSPYGAAGSLVIILLWVYYSSQILFFGAEFTQVYANRYGSKVSPRRRRQLEQQEKERQAKKQAEETAKEKEKGDGSP